MTALADFTRYLAECPLIAIIRGVRPDEADAVGGAIIDAGIRIVEVPLNSPDPFASIEKLAKRFGEQALIGGGTVLDPDDVKRVARAGGRIIVSPSTDAAEEVTMQYPVGGKREPVYALMRGLGFSESKLSDKFWNSADGIEVSIYGAGSMARHSEVPCRERQSS